MKICKIAALVMACTLAVGTAAMPDYSEEYSFAVTASAETVKKLPAPENFKAAADDGKVTLSWDKVDGADAYRIYQYDAAAKKFVKIKTIKSTKSTVSGLTNNTKYYFKVAAVVKSGKSYKAGTISEKISATPTNEELKMEVMTVSYNSIIGTWSYYDYTNLNYLHGKKYNPSEKKGNDSSIMQILDNGYLMREGEKNPFYGEYTIDKKSNKVSCVESSAFKTKIKLYKYGDEKFMFIDRGRDIAVMIYKFVEAAPKRTEITDEEAVNGKWTAVDYGNFNPAECTTHNPKYPLTEKLPVKKAIVSDDEITFTLSNKKTQTCSISDGTITDKGDYRIYKISGETYMYCKWDDLYLVLKKS